MNPVYRLLHALQYHLLPTCCVLCQNPGLPALDLCAACLQSLPRLSTPKVCSHGRVFAGFVYREPMDDLIHGFKFNAQRHYGRLLANLSLPAFSASKPTALVPVPLHRTRLRQRGFNQAFDLANFWGRQYGLPVLGQVLHRHRATQVQSHLKACERSLNVADAFRAHGMMAAHVALVDDVYTTGATCGAAAQVLMAHGVQRVDVWCLARTD